MLHIDYTQEYELSDEDKLRLKETLEHYKNGKLKFISSADFESQMAKHRQDLKQKCGNLKFFHKLLFAHFGANLYETFKLDSSYQAIF